ncbi:CTD nuclear envelope phosphatase 1 homolog [Drosophila madeirensis]|uniref:CTD nuclear envelope phosphatase 1 homolog n=1 Tax=Drosophila madeirensis TaxID=30013 RepID=A0AAU9FZL3_DROMD
MLIYKRPFVDLFLEEVSTWYNLCITATSNELYAKSVLDVLVHGDNVAHQRLYCHKSRSLHGKDIILLDNAPPALTASYPNNIYVQDYIIGNWDCSFLTC